MKTRRHSGLVAALFFALIALLVGGCGGGGGGGSASGGSASTGGDALVTMRIPDVATATGTRRADRSADIRTDLDKAFIMVSEYDENAAWTYKAGTNVNLTFNSSAQEYRGSFRITSIPVGSNYICEGLVFSESSSSGNVVTISGGALKSGRVAQSDISATPAYWMGGIVDSITRGVTSRVTIDSRTTIVAASALRYAQTRTTKVALGNTAAITTSVKNALADAVDDLYTAGTLSDSIVADMVTATGEDPFDASLWPSRTSYVALLDSVIDEAGLNDDTTAPVGPTTVKDGLSDDIDTQTSTTSLSANWAAATDAESGITAYYYSVGTTAGATNTVDLTSTTSTSITLTGLTLTASTTYYVSVKAQNGAGLFGSVVTSDGVTVQTSDTTAPQVSSFSPAAGATNVAYNATIFKVIFNESMATTVNLNTQATLTASGFSISLQNPSSGGTLTINTTNALNYGTFSWLTTTTSNDTLAFTLLSRATLSTNGLKILYPNTLYSITARTVPTNLTDAAGNALSTTGIASTGSFTTTSDTTSPAVSSFSPISGATGVASNGTVFKVIFDEGMNTAIDLNNANTLSASGFSISLQRGMTGGTLTINSSNALNYGTFAWTTTSLTNDTLSFTLKSSATLTTNGLKTLAANTVYYITGRTVPSNLVDAAGNQLSATSIATTGSFTTAP